VNLNAVEIKAFVPTKDYELSKRFYEAIGFTCAFADDEIAYLHVGNCSFLLQNFHVVEHTQNFMMHLLVENADDWYAHLQKRKHRRAFQREDRRATGSTVGDARFCALRPEWRTVAHCAQFAA
jgi:hypothetical protein